jgi:cellulose synthase/poly-beta-1,6-N-acetylglucosamine synthase-like glycosyltransferase
MVSILLPVRNAESTLGSCIESIERQTFREWECIAVDDSSADRSGEILGSWARRDARVRAVNAPRPGGIVAALEEARRFARAPLLARHDADDRSLPSRLGRQLEAIRSAGPEIAVLGCATIAAGTPATAGMLRYHDWLDACARADLRESAAICARDIWIESPIAHPTALMRADRIAEAGGFRECDWPEDYDLWLRCHRAGHRLASLSERLYEWTDHAERLSRRDPRYSPEAFLRCRVHHLRQWVAERGPDRPLVVWGAGRDGKRFARAWEAPDHHVPVSGAGPPAATDQTRPDRGIGLLTAFVDIDPLKIGRTRRGRPILSFEEVRERIPDAFFFVAVGVEGARELIRSRLRRSGRAEEADFVCVH